MPDGAGLSVAEHGKLETKVTLPGLGWGGDTDLMGPPLPAKMVKGSLPWSSTLVHPPQGFSALCFPCPRSYVKKKHSPGWVGGGETRLCSYFWRVQVLC